MSDVQKTPRPIPPLYTAPSYFQGVVLYVEDDPKWHGTVQWSAFDRFLSRFDLHCFSDLPSAKAAHAANPDGFTLFICGGNIAGQDSSVWAEELQSQGKKVIILSASLYNVDVLFLSKGDSEWPKKLTDMVRNLHDFEVSPPEVAGRQLVFLESDGWIGFKTISPLTHEETEFVWLRNYANNAPEFHEELQQACDKLHGQTGAEVMLGPAIDLEASLEMRSIRRRRETRFPVYGIYIDRAHRSGFRTKARLL